jgi:Lar family restriction alleviation protein
MKNCPFCGAGEADLSAEKVVIGTQEYFYRVRCTNCDAYGPSSVLRRQAREAWDERPENAQ